MPTRILVARSMAAAASLNDLRAAFTAASLRSPVGALLGRQVQRRVG